MDAEKIENLLRRYLAGECSEEERQWVENWYEGLYKSGVEAGEIDVERAMRDKQEELMQYVFAEAGNKKNVRSLFGILKWTAAAVLLLIAIVGYFYFTRSPRPLPLQPMAHDKAAPQKNRATVTLSDGQTIYLDSTQTNSTFTQGGVRMVKKRGGEIAYEKAEGNNVNEIHYNTLTNPRGSRVIQMVLEDGSRVWLNAGSAVTYPVLFAKDIRRVVIEGEAYFEVKPEKKRKFEVHNGETAVEVLGTSFNVNTFKDDGSQNKITLLEGSVRIVTKNAARLLSPGQQAKVDRSISVLNDVDLDAVMAWKNGYFTFNNAGLQQVLNQIARWYDVDIVYEGQPEPREFYGDIQRDLNLSEILKLLEKNNVQFELRGNKLIVKPLKQRGM